MPAPSLTRRDVAPSRRPAGLVLMLHGGKADGLTAVDDSSASWRRSRWMMQHIADRLHEAGVSVWLLRYGVRGWNERSASPPSPVPDARWALEQVRRDPGEDAGVPVVLLGHSMGARTAVAVAASVELHDMGRVGHYMFRRIPAWNAFAVSRCLAQLGVPQQT